MTYTKVAKTRQRIWTDRQRDFMVWLATPEEERFPKTQRELAVNLQCDPATLSDWKQIPGFLDVVREIVYDELQDAIPDVLRNIKRRAMYGDKADFVNLFFSLMGGTQIVAGANATLNIQQNQMTEDEATTLLESALDLRLKMTARITPSTDGGEP